MIESGFWGSGWSFPPTFELANYQLNLVHNQDNINQSIDQILNTRKGERSLYPAFGSDLNLYLFKAVDATLKGEIVNSVKASLLDLEPRINVTAVTVDVPDPLNGLVQVGIQYVIKKTNTRHNHVYPFFLNEGTGLLG
ncbi:MAG TPA: GPW/gp25 family protein [Candidatus Acidoferrum sp.]|nr:GPW/gp25 family protein [Candidatus Acidoferrum sp.]